MRFERRQSASRLPGGRPTRQTVPIAIAWWVGLVTARPVLSLMLVAVLLAGAVLGATRLGVDTDSRRMLAESLPFRQNSEALEAAFPELRNSIAVVVRSDLADSADAAAAALVEELREREDVFEWVHAPTADPFLVSHAFLYLPTDELESRLSGLGRASDLLAALRVDQSFDNFLATLGGVDALASREGAELGALEPFYAEAAAVFAAERRGETRPFDWSGAFGGEAGATRVVTVGPALDFAALQPARAALAAIDEAIAGLDPALTGPVEIGVTGDPALRAEELRSVTDNLAFSTVLSLLCVVVLLRIALGSFPRVVLAVGGLGVTLALTAGFAGFAIGHLNLVSIAFVVLMVGLGIDYAIHFISHFDEHRTEVSSRRVALSRTGRAIGPPLVLSALTTALAFFAFATTNFVGMAQLGAIGGAGVLIALAVTLTVVPAALTLWPRLDAGPRPKALPAPPRWLVGGAAGLLVLAGLVGAALAPSLRFAADPMALRDPESPSVRAYNWLAKDDRLTPLRLNLLVEDAEAAQAAVERLTALPEVAQARWLGGFVPTDQDAKLDLIDLAYPSILHAVEGQPSLIGVAEAPATPEALAERLAERPSPAAAALAGELAAYAERETPAREAALSSALFLYFPMLIDRLAAQLEADEVALEELPASLRDPFVSADGRLRIEILPAFDIGDPDARRDFVKAVQQVAPGATGPVETVVGAAEAVSDAVLQATALALAGCALLAWASLRDVARVGAILAPLLLAGAATAGASVVLGVPFNYANVIVLPLLIGIGVDSGVHVAMRAHGALGSVFDTSTPRAVLFSALTTIAAFGSLAFSSHPGTASMGVLLAVAVAASVGMTFAVTPFLIRLARRRAARAAT